MEKGAWGLVKANPPHRITRGGLRQKSTDPAGDLTTTGGDRGIAKNSDVGGHFGKNEKKRNHTFERVTPPWEENFFETGPGISKAFSIKDNNKLEIKKGMVSRRDHGHPAQETTDEPTTSDP